MPSTAAAVIARAEKRARRDPRFAEVLAALVDSPTTAAGDYTRAVARELNRTRRDDAVDQLKAGALTTGRVQELLGYQTPQAVHRLRSRGKLLGVPLGNATWFPAWQLVDGRLRPDLPRIIELLDRFTRDVIAADRVMRVVRDDLGGRSIADALDQPRHAGAAWSALAELAS